MITDSRQGSSAWNLTCAWLSATLTRDQIRQKDVLFALMSAKINRSDPDNAAPALEQNNVAPFTVQFSQTLAPANLTKAEFSY